MGNGVFYLLYPVGFKEAEEGQDDNQQAGGGQKDMEQAVRE